MKAVDYFEKYKDVVNVKDQSELVDIGWKLTREMIDEAESIAKTRHIIKDSSTVAIILEQNDKYNAVCSLFEKNFGFSPFVRNGFIKFCEYAVPEIKEYAVKH